MRNFLWLTVLLVVGSEALVLHWLLLAWTGEGLTALQGLAWMAGLGLANAALLVGLRGFARGRLRTRVISRVWMLSSLGALFSGPPLFVVFALGGGLLWLLPSLGGSVVESALVGGGGLAVAFGFGSILWGYLVGQRRLLVERLDLPIRGLPARLAGLRIAHITDLHIGPQLRAPLLRRFVGKVNELEPDLIVITGDLFDSDPQFIDEGCEELAHLWARHGVYAVLGNHDVYTGAEAVARGIERLTSIHLLRDSWAQLRIEETHLCVAGIDDPGRGWTDRDAESPEIERLAKEIPSEIPSVLLIHRPSFFRQAARLGFPVCLAGHTHGGQMSFPGAQHQNLSRLIAHWTRGLFQDGESLLYVNRGLGVAGPPIRLNCPREIALLRLVERR
ncbi:MAG: metallophosphoesterase [Myxococcota bacterium]